MSGVKSVISKASGSKADVLAEPGDKIHFGGLSLEVIKDDESQMITLFNPRELQGFSFALIGVNVNECEPLRTPLQNST